MLTMDTQNNMQEVTNSINTLKLDDDNNVTGDNNNRCEPVEEVGVISSEDELSETLRYRDYDGYSSRISASPSNATRVPSEQSFGIGSYYSGGPLENGGGIQIPIVGYEIMEERARFTVYKLRIENKGDCWYVFRRYTDFVRLCNRLKSSCPDVVKHLPRKRWLGNNFDPVFLEERVNGLQTFVNAILNNPDLIDVQEIQDFFCLNEPPSYTETNEESRAMFEALEETINDLKHQLNDKEILIDSLQDSLHSKSIENDNLKKVIRASTMNCQKCNKDCENLNKIIQ